METKFCTKCSKKKSLEEFYINISSCICINCRKIEARLYYYSDNGRLLRKKYRSNNLKTLQERERKKSDNDIKNLTDKYIKLTLVKNFNYSKNIVIPEELKDLKRIQLKLYRLCQQLKF